MPMSGLFLADCTQYTWTGPINRMLRKNRAPDPLGIGGLCDGVDLNRNYAYAW